MDEENKSREKFTNTKSIVVGAIVLAVIIASFWLSFSLGKRVFVPVRPEDKDDSMALEMTGATPSDISLGSSGPTTPRMARESKIPEKTPEVDLPRIDVKVTPLAVTQPAPKTETKKPAEIVNKPVRPVAVAKKPVTKPATKPAATAVHKTVARVSRPVTPAVVTSRTPAETSGPQKWVFYFKVLAGSFSRDINARQLASQLKSKGFDVFIDRVTVGGQKFFRVQTGAFAARPEAENLLARLKAAGFDGYLIVE